MRRWAEFVLSHRKWVVVFWVLVAVAGGIRGLLVPSLVSLFGSWNWYLPAWVARVLRIPPTRAAEERVTV